MRSIGLTGGIASGKSTVVKQLQELGAATIDADLLGHQTYEPGTQTFKQVVEAFGEDLVAEDGTIDRSKLGPKVFGHPDGMKRLTDIVWPGIRALAEAELDRLAANGTSVAVLEAAVMIEAGWQDLVDEVWVVAVSRDTARERLMARNNFSAEEADKRIDSQITNDERLKHADVMISNDCSMDVAAERVARAWAGMQSG
ncbi:MAG: dephospho-CoA kinase [Chloroflexi bacterium]|nr:dephospho-CoA kinase [Chloroflexota bacterium]MYC00729.1 dephospho-CoA kinase [Chloroflexota bacterium]